MRIPLKIARITIWVLAITIISASTATLGLFIAFEDKAERYTVGVQPALFYSALGDDLLEDYTSVFGVAHNSGDSITATLRALHQGADVIEIDVVEYNGRLYAAHNAPLPRVGGQVFRGPDLAGIWTIAARAEVVKLDLKQTSPAFINRVADFLIERNDQQVIVTSRSPDALRILAERAPHAFRLLSISSSAGLQRLQDDPDLQGMIDGVTIHHSLVDADSAGWLQERRLTILVWTVNDLLLLNHLVSLGVDAVTTDNLAILELLGGFQSDEALLHRATSRRGAVE